MSPWSFDGDEGDGEDEEDGGGGGGVGDCRSSTLIAVQVPEHGVEILLWSSDGDDGDDEDEDDGGGSGGKGKVALLAAAAATLWMDLGDMRVSMKWVDGVMGKLRSAEEPFRHKRAAS